MAQWINVFRNNSFVNPTRLPLLCRNSRAVALAEPGLTAGWLADRRNVGKFQIFKIYYRSIMNFKNLKFTHISSISQPAVRRGSASATAPEFLLFIDRIFILFAVFDNDTALLEQ